MKVSIVSVNVAARQLNVSPVLAILEGGIHPPRPQLKPKAKGKCAKHGGGKFASRRKHKKGKRRR